jgi:hypothetical protein
MPDFEKVCILSSEVVVGNDIVQSLSSLITQLKLVVNLTTQPESGAATWATV